MGDNALVYQKINKRNNCHYPALVPNVKGLEAAVSTSYLRFQLPLKNF